MTLAVLAAAVSLSLTNASDYVSTLPANSNLLRGVGMGSQGAYKSIRGEDADFLASALMERVFNVPQYLPGLGYRWNEVGKIPYFSPWYNIMTGCEAMTNAFLCSTTNQLPIPADDDLYERYGYVTNSFVVWDGIRKMAGDKWEKDGIDVMSNAYPFVSSNSFLAVPKPIVFSEYHTKTNIVAQYTSGALSFATMTNAYAFVEGGTFDNFLLGVEVYSSVVTTNRWETGSEYNTKTNIYTQYTVDGHTYSYISGYGLENGTNTWTGADGYVKEDMECYSLHGITYRTPWSIEYTAEHTEPNQGGILHVLQPFMSANYYENSLPSNGSPWKANIRLEIGRDESGSIFVNTNLTVDAWLVSLFECTSTYTESVNYRAEGMANPPNVSTTSVKRVLSSRNLGRLVRAEGETYMGKPTIFKSEEKINVLQEFAVNFASAAKCFGQKDLMMWNPPIQYPKIIQPGDYPSTVTNGWSHHYWNAPWADAEATTTRRNGIKSVKNYIIAIVHPTFHARVINDVPQ
jgi:hypothetical protein